mgnify:CR=1 FL=1
MDTSGDYDQLHSTTLYIGLEINLNSNNGGNSAASNPNEKKLDIHTPCNDFYQICRNFQDFDANLYNVSIKSVRLYDLPDYVYELAKGETRPTKGNRNKKRKSDKNSKTFKKIKNVLKDKN